MILFVIIYLAGYLAAYIYLFLFVKRRFSEWTNDDSIFGLFVSLGSWVTVIATYRVSRKFK